MQKAQQDSGEPSARSAVPFPAMKSVGRWLFNLAAAGSGVLCVSTVAVWLWHYQDLKAIHFYAGRRSTVVNVIEGTLDVRSNNGDWGVHPSGILDRPWFVIPNDWNQSRSKADMHGRLWPPAHRAFGFGFGDEPPPFTWNQYAITVEREAAARTVKSATTREAELRERVAATPEYHLQFPMWFCVAIFAVLPSGVAARWTRSRLRRREGFCSKCGYDMRATPQRCPECGAIPTITKATMP